MRCLAKIVILRHRVLPSASPMTGSSGVSSTPRLFDSITNASEYSDLILRSAPLARVSKDGRESLRCVHPSRRLLRKLLRMRSVSFAGSCAGDDDWECGVLVSIKRTFATSPRDAPEVLHESFRPKRAWGTPDARCTRGLVCNDSG